MSNSKTNRIEGNKHESKLVVLFICYARIDPVIESISSLTSEGITEFFVSIDGPKSEGISRIQSELLEKLKLLADRFTVKIHVQKSDYNLGLSCAVQSGVDWVFRHADAAIILEDDLKISPNLAKYFSIALTKLENFDKALIASANQYRQLQGNLLQCSWTTYPLIWGWGTTKSKWQEIKELINSQSVDRTEEKSPAVRGFWSSGRIRARADVLDSWALPLADAFHHGGYLAMCPPVNLCTNLGDDQYGVHTLTATKWMKTPSYSLTGEWEIPDLDFSQIQEYDGFLERDLFRIRFRHTFSPLKAKLYVLLQRFLKHQGRY